MTSQPGSTQAPARKHYHHGRSPAAWIGSILAAVGFVVGSIGFLLNINWVVVWIGAGIIALSVIAGGIAVKLGYGQG